MKTCRCCVDCRLEYTSRHETIVLHLFSDGLSEILAGLCLAGSCWALRGTAKVQLEGPH